MVPSEVLNVLLGALGAIATTVIGWFTFVKRNKTDESELALNAWKDLLAPLQAQLIESTAEIARLKLTLDQAEERHKKEVAKLMSRIKELERLVKTLKEEK